MTALGNDRKTDQLGTADTVYPGLLRYPVEASTSIYGGALVAINASGNAVPASAIGALKCVGRAERQCLNLATGGTFSPDGIANGNAGSIAVPVHQGCFYFNVNGDSTITKANFGANVYASDDNTVSLSDAGGTRPYAGFIVDPAGAMAPSPLSTQVGVMVGVSNPYASNPELATGASTAFKARAVVTTLQAYTGSGTNVLTETSNGAISAADGVTLALNDVVFIQGGTANLTDPKDSGPWTVTSLGGASAKWTLTRPDWWSTGSAITQGAVVDLSGEGTVWPATAWKAFAASGKVIGTDDPTFYVGRMTQSVALVSSATTVSNVGIKSATKSQIVATFVVAGGTVTGTVGYGIIAAPTPGYIGTASAVVDALASGMTKNGTADTSTVAITVINW
jgi:hypothetical protein